MESLEYIEKYVTQNLWRVINVVWSSALYAGLLIFGDEDGI